MSCVICVADVCAWLDRFAPPELAESWDNTGLLAGDPRGSVTRVLTCLTFTPDVAAEVAAAGVQLVVAHHPVLFRPVQQLTTATADGRALLTLIQSGGALYSPHTRFDSARQGINQRLAESLHLVDIRPLRPATTGDQPDAGGGRIGRLREPCRFDEWIEEVKRTLGLTVAACVGNGKRQVSSIAVACGAAAEFLQDARRAGGDVLITGEARFHDALLARELEIGLILAGHYATERPAVETLAQDLAAAFPQLDVRASHAERDPLRWV